MNREHDIALPPHMRPPHPQPAASVRAEPFQSHSQPRSQNWLPAPLPSLVPLAAPNTRHVSPPLERGHEPAPALAFGPMQRSEQLAGNLGPMRRSEELAVGMNGGAAKLSGATCGSRSTDMQPAPLDRAAAEASAKSGHGEARTQNGRSAVTASAKVGNHERTPSTAAAAAADVRHRPGATRGLPRIAEDSLGPSLRRHSPRSRSRSPRARVPPEQRAEASEAGARSRAGAGRSPPRRSTACRSRCAGFWMCYRRSNAVISSIA